MFNVKQQEVIMRNSIGITFITGLLVACASPVENTAAVDQDVDGLIQTYSVTCQKQGYAPDSHAWRNCIYQTASGEELTNSSGSGTNFQLQHRLGQRLGLIKGGGTQG
jgi:hypothetical protein